MRSPSWRRLAGLQQRLLPRRQRAGRLLPRDLCSIRQRVRSTCVIRAGSQAPGRKTAAASAPLWAGGRAPPLQHVWAGRRERRQQTTAARFCHRSAACFFHKRAMEARRHTGCRTAARHRAWPKRVCLWPAVLCRPGRPGARPPFRRRLWQSRIWNGRIKRTSCMGRSLLFGRERAWMPVCSLAISRYRDHKSSSGGIAGKQLIQHFAVERGAWQNTVRQPAKGARTWRAITDADAAPPAVCEASWQARVLTFCRGQPKSTPRCGIRGFLLPAGGSAHHHEQQKLLERDAKVAGVVVTREGPEAGFAAKTGWQNAALCISSVRS